MATQRSNLESGALWDIYTGVAVDLDLRTAYPGWAQGKPPRLPRLVLFAGGNLVVKNEQGTTKTLPTIFAGIPLPGVVAELVSAGTAATAILVIW